MMYAPQCEQVCEEAQRCGLGRTHTCSPECLELKLMVQDFEERALALFNEKRRAGVSMRDDNGSPATREALFWRKPDGAYGVEMFNAAWTGYVWAYRALKGK